MSRKENVEAVGRILDYAAKKSGRTADRIRLIAVSKTFEVPDIQEIYDAGIRDFAENRVQELTRKAQMFAHPCEWHFIGRLQTNKVKDVLGRVSLIHSLDRMELAAQINKRCSLTGQTCEALVQVNVSAEQTKTGIDPDDLDRFLTGMQPFKHIHIRGLMTIAPYTEDPEDNRHIFARLRDLRDAMQVHHLDLKELSMGMSGDFRVAIEEGATMIRLGSVLFGQRTYHEKRL